MKRLQEPHLPNVQTNVTAAGAFALLRADVPFCSEVATIEQAAALKGVTVAELTDRVARWQGEAKPHFFGPSLNATWRGTPEEAAEVERMRRYDEAERKRLWGL